MERTLAATLRENVGSGKASKLRRQGLIPATVYGEAQPTQNLAINSSELNRLLQKEGSGKLITLRLPEGQSWVVIKEIQRDPVDHGFLHIDLLRVAMNHPINVKVPAHLINEDQRPRDGAVLEIFLRELEVNCLPGRIPDQITVDVGKLAIGSTIFVQDLILPPEVKLMDPPESPVVSAAASAVTETPTAASEPEKAEEKEKVE
jgi:large subunit ribosomal protein L25